MQALQLELPKAFRFIDVPEPAAPAAGEAVVRVRAVGICGTDYGGYLGKMPFFVYPVIPGHELGVEVVAVGPDVTHVAAGDRCCVEPYVNCQECHSCVRGLTNCCAHHKTLGVHRDGGAGGVGLSGIRLARQMFGIEPIVAEIDHGKWELARQAGAGQVIDPSADGALKALLKATGGAAAVVDFVGAGSSFAFGFGALRKGGRLVCVGLLGGATPIVPAMVSMKAVSVIGSYVGSLAEMRELMEIAKSGALPPLPMSSRPLAEATQAVEDLRAGRVRGRTILRP